MTFVLREAAKINSVEGNRNGRTPTHKINAETAISILKNEAWRKVGREEVKGGRSTKEKYASVIDALPCITPHLGTLRPS